MATQSQGHGFKKIKLSEVYTTITIHISYEDNDNFDAIVDDIN
jgi:hypothetical protein